MHCYDFNINVFSSCYYPHCYSKVTIAFGLHQGGVGSNPEKQSINGKLVLALVTCKACPSLRVQDLSFICSIFIRKKHLKLNGFVELARHKHGKNQNLLQLSRIFHEFKCKKNLNYTHDQNFGSQETSVFFRVSYENAKFRSCISLTTMPFVEVVFSLPLFSSPNVYGFMNHCQMQMIYGFISMCHTIQICQDT